MEVYRRSSWLLLLLGVSLLATTLQGVQGEAESLEGPSESECRPYIEKALKELETGESGPIENVEVKTSKEDVSTVEITTDDSSHQTGDGEDETHEEGTESIESVEIEQNISQEQSNQEVTQEESVEVGIEHLVEKPDTQEEIDSEQPHETETASEEPKESSEDETAEKETSQEYLSEEVEQLTSGEVTNDEPVVSKEEIKELEKEIIDNPEESTETGEVITENATENDNETTEDVASLEVVDQKIETVEELTSHEQIEEETTQSLENQSLEDITDNAKEVESVEEADNNESIEDQNKSKEEPQVSQEETKSEITEDNKSDSGEDNKSDSGEDTKSKSLEKESTEQGVSAEVQRSGEDAETSSEKSDSTVNQTSSDEAKEDEVTKDHKDESETIEGQDTESVKSDEISSEDEVDTKDDDSAPEEELSLDTEIPVNSRDRSHVEHLLKVDEEASESEHIINGVAEITLKDLKKLYENAIKPLEVLYKYRDLSNRHFGDSEIFSKPLILFMGPWSGGKSSIINYLLDNEYNDTSLRTGAEPSPAYFNILMHGDESEIWDGTQLAADFTFSGLQKFGQGLEERLRGVRLPNRVLEKVNIVEIPGILEVRKQVSRVFPFNDACQWFIDRADIIFLVYDPSKLDVGPETEAILDQLKGREHQTRIILNKADQVKPEELMRVQGALIWNISPLMSSPQPPIMYTTSLWSRPFETWAPARLLQAQERAFLRDLRSAIDKRIENKIASARRFAVRVRNHAKMVDCYLTTYYNHKSVFGNRKKVSDEIIEHPQDYHIYEGLSTLTNISRYDLPDPEVYRDFFKLNPLYDFQQLAATCTYFRGCPINRLDVAIAYDLPEMVGKHKRRVESALAEANKTPVPTS